MAVGPGITGAVLIAIGFWLAATLTAAAQVQYPPPPYIGAQPQFPPPQNPALPTYRGTPRYRYVPAVPPSWNYDPYTDGTVPTPHGGSG